MSEQPPKPPIGAPPPLPPQLRNVPPPIRDVPPPHGYIPPEVPPDTPLPALKLETIFKSPQTIIEPDKVQAIAAWHDYTIIVPKGSDPIIVVDRFGRKVSDFDKLGQKIITIDWGKYIKGEQTHLGAEKANDHHLALKVRELPRELQEFATHLMGDANYKAIEELEKVMNTEFIDNIEDFLALEGVSCEVGSCEIVIYSINGSIFLYDRDKGAYIFFITRTSEGVIQPPRNWERRVAEIKPSRMPEALKSIVNEEGQGIKKLNDKYSAKITDPNHDQVHIMGVGGGKSVHIDHITGVGNNICTDPSNPDIIYYCKKDNPTYLRKLDTSGQPATWIAEQIPMPAGISQVNNLAFEPNGAFFIFHDASGNLVMLEKNTLKSVDMSQVPSDLKLEFDSNGRVRRIDESGHLVIQDINLGQLARSVKVRQIAGLAKGIDIGALFQKEVSATSASSQQTPGKDYSHLDAIRAEYEPKFARFINTIEDIEGFEKVQSAIKKFESELRRQGLQQDEVDYSAENIREAVADQRETVAAVRVSELLDATRQKLTGTLSIGSMAEIRECVNEASKLKPFVTEPMRADINSAEQEFEKKIAELFRREGNRIQQEIDELTARVQKDLEDFETLGEFNDWEEFKLPKLVSRLSILAQDCPAEADEIHSKIITARKTIREVADEYKEKFKHDYQAIRVKAARRIDDLKETIEVEIKAFVERLRMKKFTNRDEAEQYRDKSPAFVALNGEITGLRSVNPDVARDLNNMLQAQLSVVFGEIERGAQVEIEKGGKRQMVPFGNVLFPKWEGEVKEKTEPFVDPMFIVDERSKQVGIGIDGLMGDIGVRKLTSYGRVIIKRLFEGEDNEDELRYGLKVIKGEQMPATYMSRKDYLQFLTKYDDWMREHSKLKKELATKKRVIDEHNAKRPKDESGVEFTEWRKKAMELYKDSAKFYAENYIALLRRIDKIRELPEEEYTNGKGYVPEWKSHWVLDAEAEKNLEAIAELLNMQSGLKVGSLMLDGHAGTGKDVLVKMFCKKTNRPYFSIDCTKWTTEYELSEDIILETKNGASYTEKLPSVVLNAILTPGAVMYFNEFNAMPQQAQMFLHALFDEQRGLTLKTESGKFYKAASSVVFAGSENPLYPGTFEIQQATDSRLNIYEVNYPALFRDKNSNNPHESQDTNPNPIYSASEALRIARGVESLIGYTWEANMDRNEFVKMWDKVVNGIPNDSREVSQAEEFDIMVILALVQFGKKLRDDFILKFEGGIESQKALPINRAFTLREAQACAWSLSHMSPEAKMDNTKYEQVARDLITKHFLIKIRKKGDRKKVADAMAGWSVSKRVATA